MPKAENPFERQLASHAALVETAPVDHDNLLNSLDALETTGSAQIGAKALEIAQFGQTMRDIYTAAANLDVQPPLDRDEINEIQGKITTHTALAQTGLAAAAATPTDTSKSKTSGRKS